jgi:hypothetical protein
MLRLVAAIDRAPNDRAQPRRGSHLRLVADDQPRAQLLNTMRLVAGARRQAIRRIRHRRLFRQMTVACLMTVVAGILAILALQAGLVEPVMQRRLAVVGLVTAVAALLLASRRDNGQAALVLHELEACVEGIEALLHELETVAQPAFGVVHHVRRRYGETLRRCAVRHVHADYLAARLTASAPLPARLRARLHYVARVYVPDGLVMAIPLTLLLAMA